MATEPIQSGPYPVPADPPDGPNQMSAIVTWAAGRTVMRFASTAARDAAIPSPIDGMECWTGTTRWARISGAWADVTPPGAWTPYTPTFPGWTLGASTTTGRHVRTGKTVTAVGRIVLGAGFVIPANATVALPVPALIPSGPFVMGLATALKSGVGYHTLWLRCINSTQAQFVPAVAGATGIGPTVPITFAANDTLDWNITYEAA